MRINLDVSLSFFFSLICITFICILPSISADNVAGQITIAENVTEVQTPSRNITIDNSGSGGGGLCIYNENYDWACASWSECTNGKQIRECKKYNNCGNMYERPSTEMNCENRINKTQNDNASLIDTVSDTINNTDNNLPKEALFDIIADVVLEPKIPGDDLLVKISLVDFGVKGIINADLTYSIMDSNGAIVRLYTKNIPVTVQTEFLDHINTTGLTDGKYTLDIDLKYLGQTYPAHTEKVFYIGKKAGILQDIYRNTVVRAFALSVMTMALLIGIYRRDQKNKLKEEINTKAEELNHELNIYNIKK